MSNFTHTNNTQSIKNAVNIYIDNLLPLNKSLIDSKYNACFVEYNDITNEYHLIQKETTINSLELCLESNVISFQISSYSKNENGVNQRNAPKKNKPETEEKKNAKEDKEREKEEKKKAKEYKEREKEEKKKAKEDKEREKEEKKKAKEEKEREKEEKKKAKEEKKKNKQTGGYAGSSSSEDESSSSSSSSSDESESSSSSEDEE
jgi:outer membrane biosynthesis protein TonB